jgi:hypothetical protein
MMMMMIIIIIYKSVKLNYCHSKEERGFCYSAGTVNNIGGKSRQFSAFWDTRKPLNYLLPLIGYGNRNNDRTGK